MSVYSALTKGQPEGGSNEAAAVWMYGQVSHAVVYAVLTRLAPLRVLPPRSLTDDLDSLEATVDHRRWKRSVV